MLTLKAKQYSRGELQQLLTCIDYALHGLHRINGCNDYSAHCDTCTGEHVCADLCNLRTFVRSKLESNCQNS